jgi:hypothetical protein
VSLSCILTEQHIYKFYVKWNMSCGWLLSCSFALNHPQNLSLPYLTRSVLSTLVAFTLFRSLIPLEIFSVNRATNRLIIFMSDLILFSNEEKARINAGWSGWPWPLYFSFKDTLTFITDFGRTLWSVFMLSLFWCCDKCGCGQFCLRVGGTCCFDLLGRSLWIGEFLGMHSILFWKGTCGGGVE